MATARRAPALSDHGLAGRRKRGTREGVEEGTQRLAKPCASQLITMARRRFRGRLRSRDRYGHPAAEWVEGGIPFPSRSQ